MKSALVEFYNFDPFSAQKGKLPSDDELRESARNRWKNQRGGTEKVWTNSHESKLVERLINLKNSLEFQYNRFLNGDLRGVRETEVSRFTDLRGGPYKLEGETVPQLEEKFSDSQRALGEASADVERQKQVAQTELDAAQGDFEEARRNLIAQTEAARKRLNDQIGAMSEEVNQLDKKRKELREKRAKGIVDTKRKLQELEENIAKVEAEKASLEAQVKVIQDIKTAPLTRPLPDTGAGLAGLRTTGGVGGVLGEPSDSELRGGQGFEPKVSPKFSSSRQGKPAINWVRGALILTAILPPGSRF